jgi:prevent-host-death family protein
MGKGDVVITGMEEMRKSLSETVDAAAKRGEHVVVRRHGRPVAVIIPVDWYIEAGGDPRGPLPTTDAR